MDKVKTHTWILIAVALLAIGCAKKDSTPSSSTALPTPYVPDSVGPGEDPGDVYGSTVPLKIASISTMEKYTGRVMSSPQQVEVNLNLEKYGSSYGGTVRITYSDAGQRYEGFFTSGHSAKETKYNVFFTKSGKKVWHGFFEDYLGAIVVVLDNVVDLGDGGAATKASGSIWFKNFGYTFAPRPPNFCWFVSLGPYDCRAWKSGQGVETTRAVNPDNGYIKLGTFTGIDIKDAFNGEATL